MNIAPASTSENSDLRAAILAATVPGKRRLVVRMRPPDPGIEDWLRQGAVTVDSPLGDLARFRSPEEVKAALISSAGEAAAEQAPGLFLFRSLEAGDVVVLAGDDGVVRAAGLVTLGYADQVSITPMQGVRGAEEGKEAGAEHHQVAVAWWTSTLPYRITPPPSWRYQGICEFPRDRLTSLLLSNRSTEPAPEPPFPQIVKEIARSGLVLPEAIVRRYHLAMKTRGFVILAGISGTGKTWLAECYAAAVGAQILVVPVAPNWTSNEDLLGYFNPLDKTFHSTAFSRFLEASSDEFESAKVQNRTPQAYHLVLDEMNLARVEHYFAKFLSVMEQRGRGTRAEIELAPEKSVSLPPNLYVVGTVNIDETTHGFADKVFDRAQLVELAIGRDAVADRLRPVACGERLLAVWDALAGIAPFAFRVIDDIDTYVRAAEQLGVSWATALDEQVLQKVLPKIRGTDSRVGDALMRLDEACGEDLPLSQARARSMYEGYLAHGFASFFA